VREAGEAPFAFDRETYDRWIRFDRYLSLAEELEGVLAEAVPLVRPRYLIGEFPVQAAGEEEILIGGRVFTSSVLAWNLKRTDRVWAYVVTCGREIAHRLEKEADPLRNYWIDALAEMAVQSASAYLENRMKERLLTPGSEIRLTYMNPGSADREVWPLEDQRELFSLLGDTEGEIGVSLNGSCLMEPAKSLSGFYFLSPVGFVSCWVCSASPCKTRQAPYKPDFRKNPSSLFG